MHNAAFQIYLNHCLVPKANKYHHEQDSDAKLTNSMQLVNTVRFSFI